MMQNSLRNDAFAHLHVHTVYSLLDGACRIEELLERVQEMGQRSVAITDHGNLYGAVAFAQAAEARGIHPVIGCEVYMAPNSHTDKHPVQDRKSYHLLLLCENETGYRNLVKLVTAAHLEGFYYHPRIDWALLEQHHEGLIALSACLAGELPEKLLSGDWQGAVALARRYEALMGKGNYYLEVQNHGLPEQQRLLPLMRRLSQETGIPLAATNDAHYLTRADAAVQDVLLCIQTGKTLQDENRLQFEGSEFYLKSTQEMAELFPNMPEAVTNTAAIAERCQVHFETGKIYLPKFEMAGVTDTDAFFEQLCMEGMRRRYGDHPTNEVQERMAYEMKVIRQMGYVDYFLIVWDYIRFARSHDIPVGPGRGSGAGSICAYCMDITQIDPIAHQLLFERFLNPERVSMPDFDIDFCIEGRQAVKDYVVQRYGKERVSEIITFDLMKARGAIRDAGRAMGISYGLCDKIAKLIDGHRTIQQTLTAADSPDFRTFYEQDAEAKRLIDMAMRLEGIPRHTSTHAAGVIISAIPIQELAPLQRNDEVVVTQYTMTTLEQLGLLKFDFLGLRNLTVIRDCVREIHREQPDFDIAAVPVQDAGVYRMMAQGDTVGVFQFESAGMRRVLMRMQPENLEDLTAVLSLYRPGPRDSIPKYIENRHHPQQIRYAHPLLEPILRVTNGCIVYQEQVMEICRKLAGYTYGRADLVRRAMAKKKQKVMDAERQVFLYGDGTEGCCGAVKNGVPEAVANQIFDEIAGFASYAFNKSHAVAYAFLAYQTAYLKYHHFAAYMAALMTSVIGDVPKLMLYVNACEAGGVHVLPPHVNESDVIFKRSGKNIRFGLMAVKGLGRVQMEKVIAERQRNGAFTSLADFCGRTSKTADMNRRTVEILISCGALDGLGMNRHEMIENYDEMLMGQRNLRETLVEGQMDLFGDMEEESPFQPAYHAVAEYPMEELLRMEKEATGMYLSGHPLARYRMAEKLLHTAALGDVTEEGTSCEEGTVISVIALVQTVKRHQTKKGDAMCFFTLEDRTGAIDAVVFPSLYAVSRTKLTEGSVVFVKGRLTYRNEQVSLLCDSLLNAEELERKLKNGRFCCKVASAEVEKQQAILSVARQYPGTQELCFYLTDRKKTVLPKTHEKILPDEAVWQQLAAIAGASHTGII